MEKQQMLERIYEVIADKQLSLGCVLKFNEKDMDNKYWPIVLFKYIRQWSSSSEWYDWYRTQRWDLVCANMRQWEFKFITKWYRSSMHRQPDEEGETICDEMVNKYFTIIWHPVMVGDVLDWIRWDAWDALYKKYNDIQVLQLKILKYFSPRKPIDDQSEKCIKFVYDLLPTK